MNDAAFQTHASGKEGLISCMNNTIFLQNYITSITAKKRSYYLLKSVKCPFTIIFSCLVGLTIAILLIRSFIPRKKNTSVELFIEALRNENSGNFEAAITAYESALIEVKKNKFRDDNLKDKITEKLKVLHSIIEYKNNSHFRKLS